MSVFFNLINEALQKENIDSAVSKEVPKQFYCKNYDEFAQGFFSLLSSISTSDDALSFSGVTGGSRKIFILTDGVVKNSELNSDFDVTEKIISLLKIYYSVVVKNLANECNINSAEIHASEYFLKKTKELVTQEPQCNFFISLGSGTITDLLKHALYLTRADDCCFVSIPTAMTVTAFSSSFSVIDISGAKRTRPSQNITATFWIEPLLQAAPIELSRAGYGDLLARFMAYGDWYLGYKLGVVDKYDEIAYRLMDVFAQPLKNSAENIGKDILDSNIVEALSASLAMAGIAMSVVGETTPLSGYEHVISHALDFVRLTSKKELVLHGEQVALACLTSAMSFDWLLNNEIFDVSREKILSEQEINLLIKILLNKAFVSSRDLSNDSAAHNLFLQDYLLKNEKWVSAKENFSNFLQEWPMIKIHLSSLTLRSVEMEDLIRKAKLPLSPEETTPPISGMEYRWAVRFSPFVRSRFCIADFIFWLGEDPCCVAAV